MEFKARKGAFTEIERGLQESNLVEFKGRRGTQFIELFISYKLSQKLKGGYRSKVSWNSKVERGTQLNYLLIYKLSPKLKGGYRSRALWNSMLEEEPNSLNCLLSYKL